MTANDRPEPVYGITESELMKMELRCIHPESDECLGDRCEYYDKSCIFDSHDVADNIRSRGLIKQEEHDAAIRADERERVLDEIVRRANTIRSPNDGSQ